MSPIPSPRLNDPKLQAVFDALDAYIAGTEFAQATSGVTLDGSGATHSMSCQTAGAKNSFTYTERQAGVQVSVAPPSATLGPGGTQQFTASATNADGSDVAGAVFAWAVTGGTLGSIDDTGLYTAPAAIAVASIASVSASLVGGQSWASATVSLTP